MDEVVTMLSKSRSALDLVPVFTLRRTISVNYAIAATVAVGVDRQVEHTICNQAVVAAWNNIRHFTHFDRMLRDTAHQIVDAVFRDLHEM